MPAPRSATVKKRQQERADRLRNAWQRKKGELGLIQKDLANRLGWQTQGAVGHVFSGNTPLTIDLLLQFCAILQVSPREIIPELKDLLAYDDLYGNVSTTPSKIHDVDLNLIARCIKALEEAATNANVTLTDTTKNTLIEFLYAELTDANRDSQQTLQMADRLIKIANLPS